MFLLTQIWWLLLIAYLLGAFFGYIVWRACGLPRFQSLKTRDRRQLDDRIAALERENARLQSLASEVAAQSKQLDAERAALASKASAPEPVVKPSQAKPPVSPLPPMVPMPMTPRAPDMGPAANGDGMRQGASIKVPAPRSDRVPAVETNGAVADLLLDAPINGKADNLRLIRGIGPRLEKILNAMGVFNFEQIASWTDKDLALIDARLGAFAGRAVRDKWIDQSRKLAGQTPSEDNA